MHLYNNKGFSTLQVLIFSGISMTMTLALMATKVNADRQNQLLERKLDVGEIEKVVAGLTSDDSACSCMFKDIAWPVGATEITLNTLKNGCNTVSNPILLRRNTLFRPRSSITIQSIKLKNFSNLGGGVRQADLEISVTADIGSYKAIRITPRLFGVQLNKIAYCLTSGSEAAAIIKCATNSPRGIFVGSGVTFNGQTSDTRGCLPMSALRGPAGTTGPPGIQGPSWP